MEIKMNKKLFKSWNEEMFLKYNNIRMYKHPNPFVRYTENKRVNLILYSIENSHKKVLDLGCGEGYITDKINRKYDTFLVAGDISANAINMGRDLNLIQKRNNPVMLDAEKVPFKNETFDYIICTELLEHTVSPQKVLKEIDRILKKDGTAIITVPNEPLINKIKLLFLKLNIFDLLLEDVPKDMTKEWHLHSFDLDKLKEIMHNENISMDIIKTNATPFSIFPVRYIIKCFKKGE